MTLPRLFIATPMYGGKCDGPYIQGLLQLQNVAQQLKWETTVSMMFNESLITRARNALAHNFIKSSCTHLLFIDADIRFDANDIVPMVNADKDIICGIYPKKEINWATVRSAIAAGVPDDQLKHHTGSFVINLIDYQGEVTVPMHEPLEVWQGGTGFMLIKREVFEKMQGVVPSYKNDVVDLSGGIAMTEQITEYFATSIEPETGRLLSEDYHFCYVWRKKCAGKIYAAPWANLAHNGTYPFEGRMLRHEQAVEPAAQAAPSVKQLGVIMPCYNEAQRIPGVLAMFASQTRVPDELIIVDDCSTDGSYEMLLALQPQYPFLNVMRPPKNLGPALAEKMGFSASTASYVFFGAMDDAWAPSFLETMMRDALANPQAGIAFCDVKEGDREIRHHFTPGYSAPADMASQMQGRFICGCASLWRRDVVEACHYFDPALGWHTDWFASQVAALTHGAVYVPEILAYATYRPNSFSNLGRRNWQQQQAIIEHILSLMNVEFQSLLAAFIWAKSMNHFPEAMRLMMEKPHLKTETNRLLLRDILAANQRQKIF